MNCSVTIATDNWIHSSAPPNNATMSTKRSTTSRSKRQYFVPTAQSTAELDRTRQEAVAMKSRIRSLELEVETLKQRLEGLRKAKNTTIIKREREEVYIQPPNFGRHHYSSVTVDSSCSTGSRHSLRSNSLTELEERQILLQEELVHKESQLRESRQEISRVKLDYEEKIDTLQQEHKQVVKELKNKLHELELKKEEPKPQEVNLHLQCITVKEKEDLLQEIEKLHSENKEIAKQLSDIIDVNVQLRESNQLLQEKCEELVEDLSIKEAKWSEREEKLQSEIRRQWGERYHEWIVKAEHKMEELQKVNQLLQSLLKKERTS